MNSADELCALLQLPGVTGAAVGARAGVSQQLVSAMVTGHRRLRPEVLAAARAEGLEIAAASLLTVARCLAPNGGDESE